MADTNINDANEKIQNLNALTAEIKALNSTVRKNTQTIKKVKSLFIFITGFLAAFSLTFIFTGGGNSFSPKDDSYVEQRSAARVSDSVVAKALAKKEKSLKVARMTGLAELSAKDLLADRLSKEVDAMDVLSKPLGMKPFTAAQNQIINSRHAKTVAWQKPISIADWNEFNTILTRLNASTPTHTPNHHPTRYSTHKFNYHPPHTNAPLTRYESGRTSMFGSKYASGRTPSGTYVRQHAPLYSKGSYSHPHGKIHKNTHSVPLQKHMDARPLAEFKGLQKIHKNINPSTIQKYIGTLSDDDLKSLQKIYKNNNHKKFPESFRINSSSPAEPMVVYSLANASPKTFQELAVRKEPIFAPAPDSTPLSEATAASHSVSEPQPSGSSHNIILPLQDITQPQPSQ